MKDLLNALPPRQSPCVVKLITTAWGDKNRLHLKKSLQFLRRQCGEFNILEEDARTIGVEEVLSRIIDLNSTPDGVYKVITCNEHRDYETGYIDDYGYKLLPVKDS